MNSLSAVRPERRSCLTSSLCLLIIWLLGACLCPTVGAASRRRPPSLHAAGVHVRRPNYDWSTGLLSRGNPNLHEVAITIDDGPNRLYGPQILAVLRAYHVPATFFVVGVRVKDDPELIAQMVADGHEVGNHTYDHQRLDALSGLEIQKELQFDAFDIFRAAGVETHVMRPPGMQYNPHVLKVTKALGYTTVSWTVAAKDYFDQTPEFIANRILDDTGNGSIILLHQDTPDTPAALPAVIEGLRKRGYSFVTISTMLAHLGV